ESTFIARTGGRDDPRAKLLGKLDRGRADAARSAMNEQCLARREPASRENIVEDGEIIFRNPRRSDHAQSFRHRQTERGMRKRIFGIAARADESAHVVAFGWHAHAFATGDGPAGDFKARNIALARRGRIDALPLQPIGPVDARRRDFDQNLAGSGFWDRRLADSYDVRAAMALEI